MCSLSYVPLHEGYVLSHNRDELPGRKSSSGLVNAQDHSYPKDLKAGGTWMGVHRNGWSACLLNGGSVPYLRKLPYKHSRGKVILQLLSNPNLEDFQAIDWSEYEPFTLILALNKELWQLVHNPGKDEWTALDPSKAHFWSSTKLYHPSIRRARENRFRTWLQQAEDFNYLSIRKFHLDPQLSATKGGLLLEKSFLLNTVSFCQSVCDSHSLSFQYDYLLEGISDQIDWAVS